MKKLTCLILGHKNTYEKKTKINGDGIIYINSNWWNCLRCGKPTQKIYFSEEK